MFEFFWFDWVIPKGQPCDKVIMSYLFPLAIKLLENNFLSENKINSYFYPLETTKKWIMALRNKLIETHLYIENIIFMWGHIPWVLWCPRTTLWINKCSAFQLPMDWRWESSMINSEGLWPTCMALVPKGWIQL